MALSPDMYDSVESGAADLIMQVTKSGLMHAVKARNAEIKLC